MRTRIITPRGTPTPTPILSAVLELEDVLLVDEVLGDEALVGEALVDEALRDEALVDEALIDEALVDEALIDEALVDVVIGVSVNIPEPNELTEATVVSAKS
jgi:hypothetical protein